MTLSEQFRNEFGSRDFVSHREISKYLALKRMYTSVPGSSPSEEILSTLTSNRNSLRLFSLADSISSLLSLSLPVDSFARFLDATEEYRGAHLRTVSSMAGYGRNRGEFVRDLRDFESKEQYVFRRHKKSIFVNWYLPDEDGRYLCGEAVRVQNEEVEFGIFLFRENKNGGIDFDAIRKTMSKVPY